MCFIFDGILTIHKRVCILHLATAFTLTLVMNAVRHTKMLNQQTSHKA